VAEQTVVVCDVCGKPATERITFKVGGRSLQKDLCGEHLADLTTGARPAKRGRRPAIGASAAPAPARRRRKASTAKKPSARRASTAKKTTRSRTSAAKRQTRRRPAAPAPETPPEAT